MTKHIFRQNKTCKRSKYRGVPGLRAPRDQDCKFKALGKGRALTTAASRPAPSPHRGGGHVAAEKSRGKVTRAPPPCWRVRGARILFHRPSPRRPSGASRRAPPWEPPTRFVRRQMSLATKQSENTVPPRVSLRNPRQKKNCKTYIAFMNGQNGQEESGLGNQQLAPQNPWRTRSARSVTTGSWPSPAAAGGRRFSP